VTSNKQKLKELAKHYITEYIECRTNFDHFCENYIKLELTGGDIYLKPYEAQSKLINMILKDHYIIVLKSRQIGISTIVQAFCAYLCTFYENTVIGLISKDGKEATDFARNIRGMLEKLPPWFKIKFKKKTEQSFILDNGAKVYASPVNPKEPDKTLRGKHITFLVIDEAAFIQKIDDAWTSLVPALSTDQMHAKKHNVPYGTLILSTPNKMVGKGKWFFDMYKAAEFGNDIFKSYIIHWKDVKELANDPHWYDTQCRLFKNNSKKIQQELELKFLPSGGSFFEEDVSIQLQKVDYEPIEKLKLFGGEYWKFAEPEKGKFYLIGVDTAPEHGLDKSAITVWDYETLDQVAEFQGKCKVIDFVKIVLSIASSYNNSLIIVESNSYGNQVVEEINNSEMAPMLYKEKRGESKLVPGLSTNAKTRPLMIDSLYSYVTEFPEIVKSKRLSLELIGLVDKAGRVEADEGIHDDLVMSAALCFYVRKYDPPLMLNTKKLQESMFSNIMQMNSDSVQLNNANILNKAKKEMMENKDHNGYINTLDFLKSDPIKEIL